MSRSYWDYLHRVPPQSYELAEPISVYRALALRNKLQLLCDVSTQHRINWVAPQITEGGFDGFGIGSLTTERILLWTQEFEQSWQRPEWPSGFDVVVAITRYTGGSDEVQAVVRIVPASAPVNDLSAPVLFTSETSTTGESTTAVVDEQVFFDLRVDPRGMFLEHAITEDGVSRRVQQGLLRIEIALRVPGTSQGWIDEVLVREYVCR